MNGVRRGTGLYLLLTVAGHAAGAPLGVRAPAALITPPAVSGSVAPAKPGVIAPAPLRLPEGVGVRPAPQAFMQIAGVTGQSADIAHRGWIELLSASWLDRGAVPGREGCRQFVLSAVKLVDPSSSQIAAMASARRRAEITVDGPGGRRTLHDAAIASPVPMSAATSAQAPARESFSVVGLECLSAAAAPAPGARAFGGVQSVTPGIRLAPPLQNGIRAASPTLGIARIPSRPITATVAALRIEVAAAAPLQPIAATAQTLRIVVVGGDSPRALEVGVPPLRVEVARPLSFAKIALAKPAAAAVSANTAPLRIVTAAAPPSAPIAVTVPALKVNVAAGAPLQPLSVATPPLRLDVSGPDRSATSNRVLESTRRPQ
ncbi:MAG: hypothetical protein WCA01_13510 [Burkholderiales bacterium]